MPVEVFHWNPARKQIPFQRQLQGTIIHKLVKRTGLRSLIWRMPAPSSQVNNFGDLLGPMIVQKIISNLALNGHEPHSDHRLLVVGSILHFAQSGDIVWGAGALENLAPEFEGVTDLDIRAVRGPITRSYLMQLGHEVPEVYGDPALLLGHLWNRADFFDSTCASKFIVIPHYTEVADYARYEECVSPTAPLNTVLARIASSELVISSSLHGLIVADAFGIPAVLLSPQKLSLMKFWDYYLGTDRTLPDPARDIEDALGRSTPPTFTWDPEPLLSAFPRDLWM